MDSIINDVMNNLGAIGASITAVIVGADKIFLVLITTMGNIRDTWNTTFGKSKY